jgi:hypothetical protein
MNNKKYSFLGIAFPVVSEMPERGYRFNNEPYNFLLRYSVTYKDDGKLFPIDSQSTFVPMYTWFETNILYRRGEAPR